MAVDFDGLFRQYFARHGKVSEDATEEEIEERAEELYHGFLHTPLPELDGRTMEEYFSEKNAYMLVEELLDCAREGIPPTDYLMDAILSSSQGEEALYEALADTGLSPGEGVAVIGLLMDLESRAPLTRYRKILLDEDAELRKRIEAQPDRYTDYIYGEWDAGGTAWLVLAPASKATAGKSDVGPYGATEVMHQIGLDTHLGSQPMGELTYGALGTVPLIVAFWPILFGGLYGISKSREARNAMRNKIMRAAERQDMAAAMDDAVRRIERLQGPEAADVARQALEDAVEERRQAALDASRLVGKEDR